MLAFIFSLLIAIASPNGSAGCLDWKFDKGPGPIATSQFVDVKLIADIGTMFQGYPIAFVGTTRDNRLYLVTRHAEYLAPLMYPELAELITGLTNKNETAMSVRSTPGKVLYPVGYPPGLNARLNARLNEGHFKLLPCTGTVTPSDGPGK